jgi:hypothetical protein
LKGIVLSSVVAALLLVAAGCRDVDGDRLYALRLDHAPTSTDWERALPRLVTVKGGQHHKLNPLPDIDSDTVHVTTASCHHGATLPAPLSVDMRAFYTESDLFLRLSWPDATRDAAMRRGRFDGEAWQSSPVLEDGFGILWDGERTFPRFTCSYACHIDNFGVSGANFHASNRMKLAQPGAWLDLWNWKAARTARLGFADDRFIDATGMHGDVPGEIFRENSRNRRDAMPVEAIFAQGDAPLQDGEGLPVGKEFRPVGSEAPGYLTDRPLGGRADVAAYASFADGRWTVVLHRRLDTRDPHDVRFIPGDRAGVPFGLSVMDNTLKEHYASVAEERLVLLPTAGE